MEKIKAAIIGCGNISNIYFQSIQENFSVLDVCACSDLNIERMEKCALQYGIQALDYDSILKKKEIQMIINLTNPGAHYTLTKQALEHGKHVYSEKMLAIELNEAIDLCQIAHKMGLRLGCAPDTFLGGGLQTARYVLDHSLIGQVHSGLVSLSRDTRVYVENLPHLYKRGGSVLYDMGCYYLTAFCSLLGEIKEVSAFGKKTEKSHRVKRLNSICFNDILSLEEDNVITAILRFAGDILVTLHLNSGTILNEKFHMELYGEKGILRMGDPNTFSGEVELEKTKNDPVKFPFTHGFQKQSRGLGAAEMAWAILENRPHRAGMEMACHVLEAVEGIFKSIVSGQIYRMTTNFERPAPLPEGFIGDGFWEPDEESALI